MSRMRSFWVCGGLVLLGAAVLPAFARNVREVRIVNRGPGPLDEALVSSYCKVRTNSLFERAVVSDDVKALLASGRFTDVRVGVEPQGDDLVVLYEIWNKRKLVSPVKVEGTQVFREGKVRDLLALNPGDFLDDPAVAARVARLKEEYRKKLYPWVEVKWEIQPVAGGDDGLAELKVSVDEGVKAGIRRIRFTGNSSIGSLDLKEVMELPAWYNPFGWFRSEQYDEDEMRDRCDKVRYAYQDRGYLDVKVGEPEYREEKPGRYMATVPITEGELYRVGQIAITGAKLYAEKDLQAAVVTRGGSVASDSAIRQAAESVRDYYESRGYMQTLATPGLSMAETGSVVNLQIQVTEGTLTQIRHVVIRGNAVTRDKVIRRELLVYPGETFDGVRIRKSETRLRNLGFFSGVESYPESTGVTNESDLVFELEEQKTGQFIVGAGFSSVDDFIGYTEVSQGNFDLSRWPPLGAGQKAKFRAEMGSTRKDFTLSFVEPWFLDRRLSLGLDLYSRERDNDDYEELRQGGAVTLGMPLPGPNKVEFRYRLEQVEVKDVADTNAYVDEAGTLFYFGQEEKRLSSSFTTTLSHDTRNHPLLPTRGRRAYVAGTLTGGPLGFDTELYDLEAGYTEYVPLWRGHVVSLRMKAEVVEAYGGTETVPLSERLFLGGARSIRGFDYRQVGPKAFRADGADDVRPSGGQSLGLVNLEYSVPVISKIRIASFFDVGNVWLDPYEFDVDETAAGAGVGIRFDFPGFPIRVDYAIPLWRDDDYSERQYWSFSIGYGF